MHARALFIYHSIFMGERERQRVSSTKGDEESSERGRKKKETDTSEVRLCAQRAREKVSVSYP